MTDNGLFKGDARADKPPFKSVVIAPDVDLIKPTPHLPQTAQVYRSAKQKRIADPLGELGLPDTRCQLDRLLTDLCCRLAAAGGHMVSAARLVEELDLRSDRALRKLMAYGHVHHRIRQLVGVEGSGYAWGDLNPDAFAKAAAIARRKGLCSLFLAGLYAKRPAAVELAQLALEFRHLSPTGPADELDAWLAVENVTPADLVGAFVDVFAANDEGRQALQIAARKHPGIFLDAETVRQLRQSAEDTLKALPATG